MQRSLRAFSRPEEKPRSISPDKFLKLDKACEELNWNRESSTPHRSETNEIAQRGVRRVKAGASSVLVSLGFKKVVGQEVKTNPTSPQDRGRVHQFGTKVFPGIFLGYA